MAGTLGEKIRAARQEAGYSNAESLAVDLGVGVRTVQRWESGQTTPSLAKLARIAALTERPIASFLSAGEEPAVA